MYASLTTQSEKYEKIYDSDTKVLKRPKLDNDQDNISDYNIKAYVPLTTTQSEGLLLDIGSFLDKKNTRYIINIV